MIGTNDEECDDGDDDDEFGCFCSFIMFQHSLVIFAGEGQIHILTHSIAGSSAGNVRILFYLRAPVITAPFSEKGAFLPSSAKMSSREQQKCHIGCFFAELGTRVPFSEKGTSTTNK
jgi:hypothetical protein